MSWFSNPSSEVLCLHRDETDEIIVDSVERQHDIEGIRFMYKQFKKNKQGVIINHPPTYENSLQVALFLGAIRHVLEKPILILCEPREELKWQEHFQKLRQCYDVSVAADSPFVKKFIFINTLKCVEQFCRRDWSVVVVHDDDFLKEKAVHSKFKADFKIWITPVDLKDNLQTFSSIFKWLFPKDKLNLNDFRADPRDRIGTISKSILLEAFLEDIVCRNVLQIPFENSSYKDDKRAKKTSKKNKDATGKKIKRSKRSLNVPNAIDNSEAGASGVKIPKIEKTVTNDANITSAIRDEVKDKCDSKDNTTDVESFIHNEQSISFDPFNEYDDISQNSQESRTEFFTDQPMFDTAERLNRLLRSHDCMDIAVDPESCFLDSDSNDSLLPLPKIFDNTSQLSDGSDHADTKETTPNLADNIANEAEEDKSDSCPDLIMVNKTDILDKPNKDDDKLNDKDHDKCEPIDEEVRGKAEQELDKENEKPITDEIKQGPDKVEQHLDEMEVDEDNEKKESDDVMKESDKVKESPNKVDLDAKIREMDERAFKKFKGSILDTLF